MHHPDFSESPSRRMSNPSVFAGRRGSNPGGGAAVQTDEHQLSGMMPHIAPAGSSSPGPHHPPHTLSIHPQGQSVGAQVKKKSGFQITSVLPAQVSASGNNSIADDTESYDDMDESHTEDLSSSDILDVSVSRATDTGVPERSSSEETLNSLHGGETPGITSPNEPVMHHPQQGYMVNGVHHHHHHPSHQPHGHHKATQGKPAVVPASGVGPATIAPVPSGPATQGKITSGHSVQAAVMEGGGPAALSHPTALAPVAGVLTESVAPDVATGPTGSVPAVAPVQPLPAFPTATQTQTNAASTVSRFRVVKLDSNSEPFRKGRWTCTEFYEKDAPPGDTAAAHRTVENIIHSEHETTSGSSSGSTLSGGGDVPQTYAAPSGPTVHTGPPPQLHVHPQDASTQSVLHPTVVSSINPPAVTVTGMLASDSSSAPVRLQQPVPYGVEGQIPPVQSSYHPNAKPPVSVSQCGMQSMEYTQIAPNIQPAAQPHQIASVSPRAAQVPIGIPGLPAAPVAIPQPLSPRPQAPAPQMGMPQTTSVTAAQLHPDQQQTGAQLSSATTSGPTRSSMPSSAAQSSMQPALQSMLHGAAMQGHHSGQGQQEGRVPPAVTSYGGMSTVTASQLEDAQRLLLQHHPLLSLPRLAAGATAGLGGQTAADVGAALGQEASADVLTGADEDSSSGASVVAIDNKIEQAMDLVKSHLMYAVREEVEVLKEQIKELIERNSQLEQENTLLKNLASPEQLAQFQAQVQAGSPSSGPHTLGAPAALPSNQGPGPTA